MPLVSNHQDNNSRKLEPPLPDADVVQQRPAKFQAKRRVRLVRVLSGAFQSVREMA